MRYYLVSDLHLEFGKYTLPEDIDKETSILLVAGDTVNGIGERAMSLIKEFYDEACEKYKQVIFITGNHDYYGSNLEKVDNTLTEFADGYSNLTFLIRGSSVQTESDVWVQGDTLWTDFNSRDRHCMATAQVRMNDYYQIGKTEENYNLITPETTADIHTNVLAEFESLLKNHTGKMIIMSHHAPSIKSIELKFKYSDLTAAYYSDLEDFIEKYKPAVWVHGHTHHCVNYRVGDTRVMANCRGYVGHERNCYDFDNEFYFEV